MTVNRFYIDRALFDAPNRPPRTFEQVQVLEFRRNDVLALPGDPVQEVQVLVGGRLRLLRITRDGREVSIAFVRATQVVVRDFECPYFVKAELSSIVVTVPRDLFYELAQLNSPFAQRLNEIDSARVRSLERRLESGQQSAQSKLARALDEMVRMFAGKVQERKQTIPRISHKVLATFAGLQRESVTVEMGRLVRAGVVEVLEDELVVDRSRLLV